jgi:predicted transcriptional regulator
VNTQDPRATKRLVRTSILIQEDTDTALRSLADETDRPLSRVIRRALEDYVARNARRSAA